MKNPDSTSYQDLVEKKDKRSEELEKETLITEEKPPKKVVKDISEKIGNLELDKTKTQDELRKVRSVLGVVATDNPEDPSIKSVNAEINRLTEKQNELDNNPVVEESVSETPERENHEQEVDVEVSSGVREDVVLEEIKVNDVAVNKDSSPQTTENVTETSEQVEEVKKSSPEAQNERNRKIKGSIERIDQGFNLFGRALNEREQNRLDPILDLGDIMRMRRSLGRIKEIDLSGKNSQLEIAEEVFGINKSLENLGTSLRPPQQTRDDVSNLSSMFKSLGVLEQEMDEMRRNIDEEKVGGVELKTTLNRFLDLSNEKRSLLNRRAVGLESYGR